MTRLRNWRAAVRAWGPPGNERLTTSVGIVLIVLLAFETLTTLALRSFLSLHIFLGLLLLPPIALKLASVGWRFMRYYTGSEPYRLAGPPRLLLRLLAPLLVASTVSLFGSGVALIVVGHGGLLKGLHGLSFAVWGALMTVHVLAYIAQTMRIGPADWRVHGEQVIAGARSRRAVLSGALVAGVILASATYPSWRSFHREHGRDDGLPHARAATVERLASAARWRSHVTTFPIESESDAARPRAATTALRSTTS